MKSLLKKKFPALSASGNNDVRHVGKMFRACNRVREVFLLRLKRLSHPAEYS